MPARYCHDAFVRRSFSGVFACPNVSDSLMLLWLWSTAAVWSLLHLHNHACLSWLRRPVCIHLAATPKVESSSSAAASAAEKGDTVRRIRLASSWQGVAGALLESSASGGEVAFALYRVGCLSCLMSAQQRAGDQPCCLLVAVSPAVYSPVWLTPHAETFHCLYGVEACAFAHVSGMRKHRALCLLVVGTSILKNCFNACLVLTRDYVIQHTCELMACSSVGRQGQLLWRRFANLHKVSSPGGIPQLSAKLSELFCGAALEASGLVRRLGRLALAQLPHLGARDVTLALDAFARLGAKPCGQGMRPPQGLLAGLAARAARLAGGLEAAQLPLVVWALGALRADVDMAALSAAIARRAADFSAQVHTLECRTLCG